VHGRDEGLMIIESSVAAGYLIAWAVRKAKRVGKRLDSEADEVIDATLDRLHEAIAVKLHGYPVLAELVEEAEAAGNADGVSELTRQQVELALTAAFRKDEVFAESVTELVSRVREAEEAAGVPVVSGTGNKVFTGNVDNRADHGAIAFGQVAGNVNIGPAPPGPPQPGRPSH
jgi:hypothetical protein